MSVKTFLFCILWNLFILVGSRDDIENFNNQFGPQYTDLLFGKK
jgi:hypothetical protein